NPAADLYGWPAAAARAGTLAAREHLSSLSVENWSLASRVAWYARPWPVHVVQDRGDQFTLWFGALADGESTLLVDWSQMPLPLPTGPGGFRDCRFLERLPVRRAGRQIAHFDFYACDAWRGSRPGGTRAAGP
ncbi:MAG TPA: glycosyl transferase, partial [Burkholderiaceae bacterium]